MKRDDLKAYLSENQEATVLYLPDQSITELPPDIGQLTKLKELDLRGNQLTALPPEIGKLVNLKKLALGKMVSLKPYTQKKNMLRELPKEIGPAGQPSDT